MNELDYWKKRCELAEKYINETPCDPDIYEEQILAHNKWNEFKKISIPNHDFVCDLKEPKHCYIYNKLNDCNKCLYK